MVFNSNKVIKLIKRNVEITFLLLLLLLTISSTTFYNNYKKLINKNYIDVINNIYFQKSVTQIFNNLTPRYKSVDHKISSGETFNKILNKYSISNEEILEIKKSLNSDYNLSNLKTNLDIKFTIDQSNSKKIIFFYFQYLELKRFN